MRIFPTRRGWKRLGIWLAILVAVALIVNGLVAWTFESRLQARLAAIRAVGDPASIAELASRQIPDEENAAILLQRIEPQLAQFSAEHASFFDTPLGSEYEERRDRGEGATAAQIDSIRAILNRYPEVELAIAEAARGEKYASLMDFSLNHTAFLAALIDHQQNVRAPARFLGWRMEVLLADGEPAEAVERGIQGLRLARLHENEPTLVAYLVAVAMQGAVISPLYDALAAGPISPELQAALDEELARRENPQRLKHVLSTERAVGADWSDSMLEQLPYPILRHMLGWPMKSYQIGVLDAMNDYQELAERPWHELQAEMGPADSPVPATGHGVMADLLTPALRAVFQAHARGLALARALRIYNALRQFVESNGREATGLEELSLPAEATIDPYSGQPLKLKQTDDGWVIYSVMENGIDDGGDFKGLKDYGVAPPGWRAGE